MNEYMNMIQFSQSVIQILKYSISFTLFDIINKAELFDHYQQQYLHKRHLQHEAQRFG